MELSFLATFPTEW